MAFWTYILHCNSSVFYTGHTDNLDNRIADHKSGRFEGFTKRYLPVELVWSQEFVTRDEAKAAEKQIKGWSRNKKLALIRGDWAAVSLHAKSKGNPSTSSGQTELQIGNGTIRKLIEEAKRSEPEECCGLLWGCDDTITRAEPACNVHPAPHTHFEIDPLALITAHKAARAGGDALLGFYHSHPNGLARPSRTDADMSAGDGKVWAIIASADVTFWCDTQHGFEPLSYSITDE